MNAIKLAVPMKFAVPFFVALAYGPAQGLAVPILGGDLASFAALSATPKLENVPQSTIVGNVGVSPAAAIAGFNFVAGTATDDPQVTGKVHSNTALAASAQAQLTTARTNLGLLGPGTQLPVDLVGLTIFPGVFTVTAGTTNLSGAVTLDGQNDPNAFWLFLTDGLTTASASVVNVINTGTGAGVFWVDASSVTLGSTTSFQGNILALTSITLITNATIGCGRVLANTAQVTLGMNTISIGCELNEDTGGAGSNGFSGSELDFVGDTTENAAVFDRTGGEDTVVSVAGRFVPSGPGTAVPGPGTLVLLGFGLAGLFVFRKFVAVA